jgi:hypothetical protein
METAKAETAMESAESAETAAMKSEAATTEGGSRRRIGNRKCRAEQDGSQGTDDSMH